MTIRKSWIESLNAWFFNPRGWKLLRPVGEKFFTLAPSCSLEITVMNEQIWCSFRSYWIRISHKICDLLKTNLWYGGKTHNSYGRTTQSFGLDLEVNSYSIHSEVFQRVKINCLLGLRELFSTIDEEKKILGISEVYSENFSMRSMKHVQFSRKNFFPYPYMDINVPFNQVKCGDFLNYLWWHFIAGQNHQKATEIWIWHQVIFVQRQKGVSIKEV